MKRVAIIGSVPPPWTGQNVQTARNAELLSRYFETIVVDTSTGAHGLNDEQSLLSRIRHYASLRRTIRDKLSSAGAEAVVWHTVSPTLSGHLRDVLTVLPGIPVDSRLFAVVHWGSFDRLFQRLATAATARRLVRRVSGFVFLDQTLADKCARLIPDAKRLVIANTIDKSLIPDVTAIDTRVAAGAGAGTGSYSILFVANMIRSKGYLELLESLPHLVERGISFQAHFVGKWLSERDRKSFEATVRKRALGSTVVHHGPVTDRKLLARLYLDADVFVLPTYYPTEAQPVSVIEALAAATPVVVSPHASLPAMVTEGAEARFINPLRPTTIARAIEELLHPDVWPEAARKARGRFEEAYAPDVIAERWRRLLV